MTDALRKAAQQALRALTESVDLVELDYSTSWMHGVPSREGQLAAIKAELDNHKAAIEALSGALAPAPVKVQAVEWDYNDDKVLVRKPGEDWREAKPSEIVSALLASGSATAPKDERDPDPLHLSRILHELAGAASLCWEPLPSGVFDSSEAIKHVQNAIAEIRERMGRASLAQAPEPLDLEKVAVFLENWSADTITSPADAASMVRSLASSCRMRDMKAVIEILEQNVRDRESLRPSPNGLTQYSVDEHRRVAAPDDVHRDAERYRWLRAGKGNPSIGVSLGASDEYPAFEAVEWLTGAEADAAIDAAMQAGEKGE